MDSGGSVIKELYISTDYFENVITAILDKNTIRNAGTITVTPRMAGRPGNGALLIRSRGVTRAVPGRR